LAWIAEHGFGNDDLLFRTRRGLGRPPEALKDRTDATIEAWDASLRPAG
jgi:hypothetical protein